MIPTHFFTGEFKNSENIFIFFISRYNIFNIFSAASLMPYNIHNA